MCQFLRRRSVVSICVLTLSIFAISSEILAQKKPDARLAGAFERAAAESGVPADLLKAIAYSETRLDGHGGEPSSDNGYGMMHLTDNPNNQSLKLAVSLTGIPESELRASDEQNIRGAAAVLAYYSRFESKAMPTDLGSWYTAVARYSGADDPTMARFYADHVFDLLGKGFEGTTSEGETLTVFATSVNPERGSYEHAPRIEDDPRRLSADYGPAIWNAANSGNYTVSSRETSYPINYVIIHITQGSYAGSISWFKNASANVSAHYVIRSSDGEVTQMVREKDVAWHAGNWTYNTQSIGIEHEGYVSNASWYTDAMYRASAALTRNICQKYGIPMTRSRIIGHNEVPGATHTDPGQYWNWTYYMQLVTQSSEWSTIVDNPSASGNWGNSTYSSQKYGADYKYANPVLASDSAWFTANLPATGNYEVYVWHPADAGYNDKTPYVVATTSGNVSVNVNQRVNGGQWRSIGTYSLAGGSAPVVGVSRWTNGTGYVIADAVRIVRR